VRSEGFMSMKYSMTPSGIEPASFRFVAQYLNHCATAVSRVTNTHPNYTKPILILSFHLYVVLKLSVLLNFSKQIFGPVL
jgi:hypothetical protein